jgi:hypothetical protein
LVGKFFLGLSLSWFFTVFLAETGGGISAGLSWGMDWPFDPAEAEKRQRDAAQLLGIERKMTFDFGAGGKLEMALIPAGRFFGSIPFPDEFKAVLQAIDPDLPHKFFYGRRILVVSGFFFFVYALFFFGKKILTGRWRYSLRDYFIFVFLGLSVAYGYCI